MDDGKLCLVDQTNRQSHFSFMAGLSFLYAFFNLYSVGGPGVPNLEEAMMDIESCLAVLDYLTRKQMAWIEEYS